MLRFAVRGLLGRKLRTVLTAIAVVLGVAMVSGTYVLTDSISSAFDSIFGETYKNTDAAITGKSAFDQNNEDNTAAAPSFDESLLPEVKQLPDVSAALGGVADQAHLIGKDGKAIVFGGAPNLGFSVDPSQPQFNSLTLVDGDWPGAGEVVIDESTADKKDLKVGDTIGVQARGPAERLRISGLVHFGAVSSIGGATLAGFDLPTAQRLFDKEGKLDQIRMTAKAGVSPQRLVAEVREILPPGTQVRTGTAQATEDSADTTGFISFLQKFLLAFGGVALFVGAFVIANSLGITIAQRTREFATIRTIGASRKQVLGSIILEYLLGRARMQELVFDCEVIDPPTARSYGLLSQVCPTAELQDAAMAMARRLAAYPRTPFVTTKRIQNQRFVQAFELVREPSAQAHVAAFLERAGQKHFERILGTGKGAGYGE